MTKKLFSFKQEELPVIAGFILSSLKKDMDDFSRFSAEFSIDYLIPIEEKNTACKELISSSTVSKELKATTKQLNELSVGLRPDLNTLEGYLKLGAGALDIAVADVGLRSVRLAISRGNTEGVMAAMQKALTAVKRNLPALEAKGLTPQFLNAMEAKVKQIESLNIRQNDLISERNRLTEKNIHLFNDLWESLQPVLNTAKAIYRGVDAVKLKDYTVAQLVKRIRAEGKRKPAAPEEQ